MSGNVLLSRVPRRFIKDVTFTGAAGAGAVGTVTVATITGRVTLVSAMAHCVTGLAGGAGATLSYGTTNRADGLLGATDITLLVAGVFWTSTSAPAVKAHAYTTRTNISENIILTAAVDATTSGVLRFAYLWVPMSADGNLV